MPLNLEILKKPILIAAFAMTFATVATTFSYQAGAISLDVANVNSAMEQTTVETIAAAAPPKRGRPRTAPPTRDKPKPRTIAPNDQLETIPQGSCKCVVTRDPNFCGPIQQIPPSDVSDPHVTTKAGCESRGRALEDRYDGYNVSCTWKGTPIASADAGGMDTLAMLSTTTNCDIPE